MITVRKLCKCFKTKDSLAFALDDVDLVVPKGEFFVLLGPSGSGKTTLLRSVAGLEYPDTGEIFIGEQCVFSKERGIFVDPEDRGLGMVFQSYAIWPHMTVFQNVALPLLTGKRKIPKELARERIIEALRLVQIESLAEKPAPLLSGGQQQRVALARSLALKPTVILMDEPLSNLDARLREEVRDEIKHLAEVLDITVLYVTHDHVEAMVLADRIGIMQNGRILQIGQPSVVYLQPVNPEVARFFGKTNWFGGTVDDNGKVQTEIGTMQVDRARKIGKNKKVLLGVRAEDIEMDIRTLGVENEFSAQLQKRIHLAGLIQYEVQIDQRVIVANRMVDLISESGIVVRIAADKVLVFADDS